LRQRERVRQNKIKRGIKEERERGSVEERKRGRERERDKAK
jgi:hypothetical protein